MKFISFLCIVLSLTLFAKNKCGLQLRVDQFLKATLYSNYAVCMYIAKNFIFLMYNNEDIMRYLQEEGDCTSMT